MALHCRRFLITYVIRLESQQEKSTENLPLPKNNEVIAKLLKVLSKFKPNPKCDEKKPDNFKAEMDSLSAEIEGKLNAFKGPDPGGSSPFFVSQLAAKYAQDKSKTPKKKVKPSFSK
jgi:hypothetical protein